MNGDFDFPPDAKTGFANKKTPRGKEATLVPEESQEAQQQQEQAEGQEDKTKAGEPKKSLYSKEELMRVFDSLLFEGEYQEEFTLKGKLPVAFRTRTQKEIAEITETVDATQAVLVSTMEQQRAILNLQYGLIKYGRNDLRNADIKARAEFVSKLPGPVIALLLTKQAEFDGKVYEACQEGESNF